MRRSGHPPSNQERRSLLGIVVLLIVLGGACIPLIIRHMTLDQTLKARNKNIQAQQKLIWAYDRLQKDQAAVAVRLNQRAPSFSLFATLNDLIIENGLKPYVTGMRPFRNLEVEGLYQLNHVEIEVQGLSFAKVFALLSEIERSPAWLVINRLDLSSGNGEQSTNAIIEVIALSAVSGP